MADVKATRISGYYGELKKFIENSNYNKVIKVTNKILAEDTTEVKAWQCKAVALINLDQFADALATLNKSKFYAELAFEKAYCEYRLNKVTTAYDTIQGAAHVTPRELELKAQILYRLERYNECHEVYRDIIRTTSDDFDMERETNMTAVEVNRAIDNDEFKEEVPVIDDNASYEIIYNGGCRLLAAGIYEKALKKLESAEEQCRRYLTQEEGATEDEVNDEVAIIRVQQGHCLQQLGREREALALYNSVLKTKPDDPALIAIINNNLVSINRTANVFDSRKRMKTATATTLEHKLTTRQRSTIALNNCLLAYHTNQEEVCRTETQALIKEYPLLTVKGRLIQAAQLGREGKLKEAQSLLNGCIKEYPHLTTNILLMTAQILLAKGDQQSACKVFSSLPEKDRNRPGIVSALVALFVALDDRLAASNVLREAVKWHQNNKTSSLQLGELWSHAADFHLRSGDAAAAVSSLLELHKMNPQDTTTLAQLITAYARYDLKAAQKLSRELPGVGSVVDGLDVEALESALGHRYFKKIQQGKGEVSPSSPKSPKTPMTPGVEQKKPVEKRKKKKRKPRLPKEYNPSVAPDPERWLPRWQRKGYRKKKDRRVKEVMKGTQGVSSEAADKFDITKTAGTHKPAQAAMSPQPESQGPRRNLIKKKGGGKKKKGGGGW